MTEMTELASLPGLESPTADSELNPGHWLERMPQKRLMVFSGRSNPDLASKIAEHLEVELGDITIKTFANGETYCRYEESIRGADVFIVQTGSVPVDTHLMELLIMINAAKLASAKRITAVVPWFAYSRQDKKSAPREPITAKMVADFLQSAGADRVLTMDLHAGQIQGFFNIPVDHMTALPQFAQHFRDKGLAGDAVVCVSPDLGLMTGGTLIAGVEALKEAGATEVYACATHGLFSGDAFEKIGSSGLKEVTVTDTVPIDPTRQPPNVKVLSVSGILAETIHNVFSDESVSGIFPGGNQLF